MKKKLLKAVCLILFFSLTVGSVGAVLRYRYPDSIVPMRRFYDQTPDSVDLLGLGTSHIYEGLAPAVLYREYGIAAYDLCAPAQAVWNTYYYFVEALKTQSPKAAVFDVYMLNTTVPYDTPANAIKSTYGMKWSMERLRAIRCSFEYGKFFRALFPWLQYHSRYADMTYDDTVPLAGNETYYGRSFKGYNVYDEIRAISLPDVSEFTQTRELAEKHEEYYRKIIELAIENKIALYVVSMPFALAKDTQTTVNSARLIAESYQSEYVKFIDLTARKDEIGLNGDEDFANRQHLNRLGSEKVTRWLGRQIVSGVPFEDRRGDPAYETWEQDAALFYRGLDDLALKRTTDIDEYKTRLADMTEGYTVMIADDLVGEGDFSAAAAYFTDLFNVAHPEGGGLLIRRNEDRYRLIAEAGRAHKEYLPLNRKDTALMTFDPTDGLTPCALHLNGAKLKTEPLSVTVCVYDDVLMRTVDTVVLSPSKGIVR